MDIVLRATAMFFIVFALLRLLGKRELAQMAPFEMVVLIVIGDLIQQGITHNDFSLTGATLAICTFAFWAVVMGWLVWLFPRLKAPLEGRPQVIVRDGELIEGNLRRDRITRRARDRAVDAFMRQQQRPPDARIARDRQQGAARAMRIVEAGEAVERGNPDRQVGGQWTKRATTSR